MLRQSQLYERAIFCGKDTENRSEFMYRAFHSLLLEKPEDVARTIQQAIQHYRADVLVGTANFWTTAFHLAPGLMKPLTRRVFGMRDRFRSTGHIHEPYAK